MGFRKRRDKQTKEVKSADEFRYSSGATNLEGVLGEHTLDAAAEANAPKGYRARSIAKTENRR